MSRTRLKAGDVFIFDKGWGFPEFPETRIWKVVTFYEDCAWFSPLDNRSCLCAKPPTTNFRLLQPLEQLASAAESQ